MAAFDAAGDPERYPDAGEPWQPLKLYYSHGFSRARVVAIHEAMLARGLSRPTPSGWSTGPPTGRTRRAGHHPRPCADYFEVRDRALMAHATQIDPTSWWFTVPLDLQREVWPTEDYELVRSLVDTAMPEDDLFAGIERVGGMSR